MVVDIVLGRKKVVVVDGYGFEEVKVVVVDTVLKR